MRQVVRAFTIGLVCVAAVTGPAAAQRPPALVPAVRDALPNDSHVPQLPDEKNIDDLRGWLDGSRHGRGKGKPFDPKLLGDLLDKMKQGQGDADPDRVRDMLRDNPQFKDPEFLKRLQEMVGKQDFKNDLKRQLGDGGPDPKIVDQVPDLRDKLGQFVKEAKQGGPAPDGDGPPPAAPAARPPLDPVAKEWMEWLEKNFGDSPAGQEALKEFAAAMGKGDLKGVFDDLPELKNGEWKDFDNWGKANFGEGWKFRPPEWNLGGPGMSGPKFGNGPNWNLGGGPNVGTASMGTPDGAGGGVSVVAIVIGAVGALVLGAILYSKWKKDQETKMALMAAAARHGLDLTHIRSRQELVEAFDALTVEKCGAEAKNWNHRVVTDTLIDARPAVAAPAQELGDLYQKARYAPPQDDLTGGELTAAERDLRAVAGENP